MRDRNIGPARVDPIEQQDPVGMHACARADANGLTGLRVRDAGGELLRQKIKTREINETTIIDMKDVKIFESGD
jgi:hypothetical protein